MVMGCDSSKSVAVRNQGRESDDFTAAVIREKASTPPKLTVTEIQVDVVRSTWPLIAKEKVKNGCEVFMNIFIAEPTLLNIFSFRDVSYDNLLLTEKFRQHALRFMNVIDMVCSKLEDLDDRDSEVSQQLMLLGAKHAVIKGFDFIYLALFSKCIHMVWERELGEEYTEEVREAWSTVFDVISLRIQDGYLLYMDDREAQDGVSLPVPTKSGVSILVPVPTVITENGDMET